MSDLLTNGELIFRVLSRHAGFVWVEPVRSVADCSTFARQGPLTFRADTLTPAQSLQSEQKEAGVSSTPFGGGDE